MGSHAGKFYFVQGDRKTELFAESEILFFTDPHEDDIFEFVWDENTKAYKMFMTVEGGIRLEALKVN